MMKKLFVIISFCIYVAILLVACSSAGNVVNPSENQENASETTLKTEE
jgi:hypothetical protein